MKLAIAIILGFLLFGCSAPKPKITSLGETWVVDMGNKMLHWDIRQREIQYHAALEGKRRGCPTVARHTSINLNKHYSVAKAYRCAAPNVGFKPDEVIKAYQLGIT